jgi:glutaredoxin
MNKVIIVVVSLIIVAAGGFLASSQGWFDKAEVSNVVDKDVLFWGNTCPHCKDVKEWMEKENISKVIEVEELEVYDNRSNQAMMVEAARGCGIPVNKIAVPFMWTTDKKCLVGTPDIQSYLTAKVNQLTSSQATESGTQK